MPYAPSNRILIVTLGSFNKMTGGEGEYAVTDSLPSKLPVEDGAALRKKRGEVFGWLKSEHGAKWQGVPVAELEWNHELVRGPDFGGEDRQARYYPALRRFQGRFFQTLGREGQTKLFRSPHHVLFLCALYGLVAPMESVQLYSCPLDWGWKPFEIWEDKLTETLIAYIRENGITRVFDLTAMNVRRNLIHWSDVREVCPDQVLHAVGGMGTGDYALVSFGQLMRDSLLAAPEEDLLAIKFGTKIGTLGQDIWFHERPGHHVGGPRDYEPDLADELDRIDARLWF